MNSSTATDITIVEDILGWGILCSAVAEVPVASIALARPKYAHDKDWDVDLHIAREHWTVLAKVLAAETDAGFEFIGHTVRQEHLHIPHLHRTHYMPGRVEGFCSELELDATDLPAAPTTQTVLVALSPTDLAVAEVRALLREGTGEVRADGRRAPFVWTTSLGQAELSRWHHWEVASVQGVPSSVEVPEAQIRIELPDVSKSTKPRVLFDSLLSDLREMLQLLSFLGRRPVRWSRISVGSLRDSGENDGYLQTSVFHKRAMSTFRPRTHDPIINVARMDATSLDQLYSRFIALPYRESIYNAISFLLATFDTTTIAPAVTSAWTALESVVDGVTRHEQRVHTLNDSTFRGLRKILERDIKAFLPGPDHKNTRRDIKNKLSELRLRPFVRRVVELIEREEIEWHNLFPENVDLEAALTAAYARRSALIHRGEESAIRVFHADLFRVHALAERLIYCLIGGRPDWLWHGSYRHCDGLTSASI